MTESKKQVRGKREGVRVPSKRERERARDREREKERRSRRERERAKREALSTANSDTVSLVPFSPSTLRSPHHSISFSLLTNEPFLLQNCQPVFHVLVNYT